MKKTQMTVPVIQEETQQKKKMAFCSVPGNIGTKYQQAKQSKSKGAKSLN